MKRSCITYGVVVLGGVSVATVSADTYFFDDFELQPLTNPNPPGTPLSPPPIGVEYRYAQTTQVEAVNIVEAPLPVIGTRSLEAIRDATRQAHVIGVSKTGALLDGKVLELKWDHYLKVDAGQNPFNAPMQFSGGYTNGGVGNLFFIATNDKVINGVTKSVYQYRDAFLGDIKTDIPATINGWDSFRLVMTLDQFDDTFMTGKFNLFVSQSGAPEIELVHQADLTFAEIGVGQFPPDPDDTLSSAIFRIQKGPNPARSYYDNITLRDFEAAPTATAWNVDANGNWSLGTNWLPTTAPNAVGAAANFGSIITAPRTVTLDAPQTVGAISFDNANSYTISGANTLTIDASSGSGALTVVSGSHTIAAPIALADNTTVNVAAGQTLSVQHLRGAGVNVSNGTLRVIAGGTPNSTAGTTKVTSLAIAAGAKLDVTNNSLIVDYTGAVGTLVGDTRQHLLSNRLDSSSETATRGLGYGDNAALSAVQSSFGGLSVDSSSILVKYTYFGDSDLDGDVDVADLGNLASSWQTANVWTGGDFDYNGSVDVNDLGLLATNWQAGVGSPLGPSLAEALAAVGLPSAAVPEPTWMGVMGMSLGAIATSRRRQRQEARERSE